MKLIKNVRAVSLLLVLFGCATIAMLRAQESKPAEPSSVVLPDSRTAEAKPSEPSTLTLPASGSSEAKPAEPTVGGLPSTLVPSVPKVEDTFDDRTKAGVNLIDDSESMILPTVKDDRSDKSQPETKSFSINEINSIIANAEAQAKVDRNGEPEPTEPTAELRLRSDENFSDVKALIESLSRLGIHKILINRVQANESIATPVLIVCQPDVSWRRVRDIEQMIREQSKYKVEVRIRGEGPTTSTLPELPDSAFARHPRNVPPLSVRFEGPQGATIGWQTNVQTWNDGLDTLPVTHQFAVGHTYRLRCLFRHSGALYALLHVFPAAADLQMNQFATFSIEQLMKHTSKNGYFRQVIYLDSETENAGLSIENVNYPFSRSLESTVKHFGDKGKIVAVISVGSFNIKLRDGRNVNGTIQDFSPFELGTHDWDMPLSSDNQGQNAFRGAEPAPSGQPGYGAPESYNGGPGTWSAYGPMPNGEPIPMGLPRPMQSGIDELNENIKIFRSHYEELDQKSQELAAKLRQPGLDPKEAQSLKEQLQDTVAKSFATRQTMQGSEVNVFELRLDELKKSIKNRENHRKEIMDRRIEELLHPSLDWESKDSDQDASSSVLPR